MPFLKSITISQGLQLDTLSYDAIDLLCNRLNQLNHLAIIDCEVHVENLMSIIAHMVNLRSLIVSVYECLEIISASRWQHLITSSLPHLTVFRFMFGISDQREIVRKYDELQSDFWIKEHRWYTECILADRSLSYIFTIPYFNDTKPIWLHYIRLCNILVDGSKTLDNVKSLHLSGEKPMNFSGFYFQNITSLIFESLPLFVNEDDEQRFIDILKSSVNLLKVQHLEIPMCFQTAQSTLLLKIFKEASHLSSLSMCQCALEALKSNKEIWFNTNR